MLSPDTLRDKITFNPNSSLQDFGEDGLSFRISYVYRNSSTSNSERIFLQVILSWGMGWDHISVSRRDGIIPSWYDLEFVKRFVCYPNEVFVQYHMSEKEHISFHEVLHLWRCQTRAYPIPPAGMV